MIIQMSERKGQNRMIEKNLWRESGKHGSLLVASSLCGILCAVVILSQAFTLAGIIAAVFMQKAALEVLLPQIGQLFLLVTVRFILQALEEHFAFSLGQAVQYDLRQALLQK